MEDKVLVITLYTRKMEEEDSFIKTSFPIILRWNDSYSFFPQREERKKKRISIVFTSTIFFSFGKKIGIKKFRFFFIKRFPVVVVIGERYRLLIILLITNE